MTSSVNGYSGDYNYTNYTPLDNSGYWNIFRSGYKNLRFNVQPTQQYQLTVNDVANLPGMAYRFFGDTSLWRGLMSYNGLSDPLSDIQVGMVFRIPTKADLLAYLSATKNTASTTITI
jgi:hypothetical protein